MAKLTARFDMEDKISKKLRVIQGGLDSLDSTRKKLEKPMNLTLEDKVTKKLQAISGFIKKDLGKKHSIHIEAADKATARVEKIAKFMERRMPRAYSVAVSARDSATSKVASIGKFLDKKLPKGYELRIDADGNPAMAKVGRLMNYLRKNHFKKYEIILTAKDTATETVKKASSFVKRVTSNGYSVTISAIDKLTKTAGRIGSRIKTFLPSMVNIPVKALNYTANAISAAKRALFSLPALFTVTIGAVLGKSFLDATLSSAASFEDYTVSMTHWLKSADKAQEYMKWIGQYADSTPFSSADLMPAAARATGLTSTRKEFERLMQLSVDMAALTPGKTVQDAMEALADAQMGEFERMKEFNMKYNKETMMAAGGFDGFMADAEEKFAGGAKGFSQTYTGMISTLKGYTGSFFRSIGEGFQIALKPRLGKVVKWLEDNQEAWGKWKDSVKRIAGEAGEWVFSKFEKAFEYIQKNFLDNEEFMSLDFSGKMNYLGDELKKWWDSSGKPVAQDIGVEFGTLLWDGMLIALKEGFKSIGGMWINAFKEPSVGNFAGAGVATLLGGKLLSPILKPLAKGTKGAWKLGKHFLGKSGGASTVAGAGVAGATNSGSVWKFFKSFLPKAGKSATSGPTYTNPWFNKGTQAAVTNANAFKGIFKLPKFLQPLGKIGGKVAKFTKGVPVLSTALAATSLIGINKKNAGGKIGDFVGTVGGMAAGGKAGAAIGTMIAPGIGTAIGGAIGSAVGGFAGSSLGKKLGERLQDTVFDSAKWKSGWESTKNFAKEAWGNAQEVWGTIKTGASETVFNGEWWSTKWQSVKDWAGEKLAPIGEVFNSVKDKASETLFNAEWWGEKWNGVVEFATTTFLSPNWWAEKIGFVFGVLESTLFSGEWWAGKWEAVKEWATSTVFNGEWWLGHWETIKGWTEGTIFDGAWWSEKWQAVKGWTQEKWDSAVEIWNTVTEKIGSTIFNGEWWLSKWESVKGWTQEKWNAFQDVWDSITTKLGETVFSSEWWLGKWESVKGWTSEKWENFQEIWDAAKTKIEETLFSADWWQSKWEKVKGWASSAWEGIKEKAGSMVDSFQSGREKGKNATKKYANGGVINQPHLGLVGEAGPEMIIPLSAGRRGRAMDLYEQTGRMLGVRPYANGGQVGGSVKTSVAQTAQASINVGVGAISVQGIDSTAQQYGKSFATSVASGINGNVVSIDTWKQNNIANPMQTTMKEAVGFGSGVVRNFATGQNATTTNTNSYLDRQVKSPFTVIQGGASSWGSGTISNFRSGQNATQIGTQPYLAMNVHTPFDQTQAKGSGWGSGTMSEFVAGMRSQSGQVQEAAKYLAEQVEQTFRKELGIHSPSRVMMKLGEFTGIGIVKGFDNVNIKKFAENQAGSLAAAFAGMGSIGGSISEWIAAAMAITGVPSSWLGPLSIIAQKESGGNPSAINLWDSNATVRGTPSMGLMQTIMPTFQAHKGAGLNNIMNPVHNAVAAINYIKKRYGTVFNTPGIRSMASGGSYRGYWKGTNGPLRSAETAWVGERGPELVHLPRGSEVFSNRESKRLSSGQVAAATGSSSSRSRASGIRDIIIQITGDNHFNSKEDMNNFIEKVKKALIHILRDEYNEGGEGVVYE